MPAIRSSSPVSPSPNPDTPTKTKRSTKFTAAEEEEYKAAIDTIVRRHILDECKRRPLLAGRATNTLKDHWRGYLKKL
ncbi:hypothetical protein Q5752_003591 [Cryptotrichosporon argae]